MRVGNMKQNHCVKDSQTSRDLNILVRETYILTSQDKEQRRAHGNIMKKQMYDHGKQNKNIQKW